MSVLSSFLLLVVASVGFGALGCEMGSWKGGSVLGFKIPCVMC